MPITFNCSCGKSLRVSDEHAGRRVKCPACNTVGFVPGGAEPEFEVVEKTPPYSAPTAMKKPVVDDDEDDDDGRGYGVAKRTREEEEEEEEKERERERRKRRKKWERREPREDRHDNSGGSHGGGVINSGIGGGILVMVIAVVWFVVGLGFDRLFIYPPILFIIGLIAFCKGLAGEE